MLWVLFVEDEVLIVMMVEDMIDSLGYSVVWVVIMLVDVLVVCNEDDFDVVLFDVNLNGDISMVVVVVLKVCGCLFVFIIGYGVGGVDLVYSDCQVLIKFYVLGEFEILLVGFVV